MAEPTRKKPRGKQPISRHPLFPATVALWCGAILALAGAVAAPRLGVPLILGLGAVGALVGLVLVRRIAAPKPPTAPQAVVATSEGENPNPLWTELQGRRRALVEESADVDFVEPELPVLVREPEILDILAADLESPFPKAPADPIVAESIVDEAATAPQPQSQPEDGAAAARLKQADLEDLSHVELLERLALGLEKRRGEAASPATSPETAPETAKATGAPSSHAAALKQSYQALLDLSRQVPAPVVEAEAPVVFPAQAERRSAPHPAARGAQATSAALAHDPFDAPDAADQPQDPAETEKALRAALAALQRMSGAA